MARIKSKEITILQSAMKLFSEKGFSKTSIQDIANEANVGKGTIYEYFESKDEVFIEGYKREVDQFTKLIHAVSIQPLPFLEKLEAFIGIIQAATEEKARKMKLLIHDSRGDLKEDSKLKLDALHLNLRQSNSTIFSEVLRQGVEEGLVMKQDVHFTSRILTDFIFVCSMVNYAPSNIDGIEANTYNRKCLIQLMMHGIAKKEGEKKNE